MEVADGDALGEEQLQHRLQAGIGDLRRADVLDQALVLGVEPVEQRAHVLVGEKLREIVADHLADMGQDDREVVDRREALAADLAGIGIRNPHRLHAEGRLARILAGHVGPAAVADHDQQLADAHLLRCDHRAVDLDLVALRRNRQGFGHLDLGNDEAVLRARISAASCRRGWRLRLRERSTCAGELLADAELDLVGLQRLLDRIARLVARPCRPPPCDFRLLDAPAGLLLLRNRVADEGHGAGERREGDERQAGDDGEHDHQRGGHEERARIVAELAEHRLARPCRACRPWRRAGRRRARRSGPGSARRARRRPKAA